MPLLVGGIQTVAMSIQGLTSVAVWRGGLLWFLSWRKPT
jgi:hypothetical protein